MMAGTTVTLTLTKVEALDLNDLLHGTKVRTEIDSEILASITGKLVAALNASAAES
jgi:hypothetical protein